jgi:hypothetical protein
MCYCSLYEECWHLDGSMLESEPVEDGCAGMQAKMREFASKEDDCALEKARPTQK